MPQRYKKMFNYQRLMFNAPITTPHTALLRTAKLSKKSLKVLLRHPPLLKEVRELAQRSMC